MKQMKNKQQSIDKLSKQQQQKSNKNIDKQNKQQNQKNIVNNNINTINSNNNNNNNNNKSSKKDKNKNSQQQVQNKNKNKSIQKTIKSTSTNNKNPPVISSYYQNQQDYIQQQQALNRLSELKQKYEQKSNKYKTSIDIDNMIKNIQTDIISKNLIIPEQPVNIDRYIIKKKQPQTQLTQQQKLEMQYRKLIQRKNNMKHQLQQIQQQQNLIKKHNSIKTIRYNKMPELTQQNRQKWLKLRQIIKQHQLQSKSRINLNESKIHQQYKLQNELQLKRNQQKSQQKRKQLQSKIQLIKKRTEQRSLHIKQQKQIIQRLKNKKKLYEKMQQEFMKQQQKTLLQKQTKLLQNYLEKRKLDMNLIKQHQKQYLSKYQQQKSQRNKKIYQQIHSSRNIFNIAKSNTLLEVIEQDKKNKLIEQEKINQIKQLIDKKKQYANIIKEKFKPKVKLEHNLNNNPNNQNNNQTDKRLLKQARSLSSLDIKHKGNQYMRTINSSLSKYPKQSLTKPKTSQKQKQQSLISNRYKNYLDQIRMNRTANSQHTNNDNNKELSLIKSIIRKPNMTQEEKFFQAQRITKKIQSNGSERNILTSINAKIEILKKLAHQNNQ